MQLEQSHFVYQQRRCIYLGEAQNELLPIVGSV